jgi:polyphenol oxidase
MNRCGKLKKAQENMMRDYDMEPFLKKDKTAYFIHEWTKQFPNLVAGFTTKHGGVSKEQFGTLNFGFHVGDEPEDVCQNRKVLAGILDFPVNQWVGAEQIHQTAIQKVSREDCGKGSLTYDNSVKKTDGFYTNESGVLLTLCYADCVPLYFIDPKTRIIGTAHAGWKGTVAGIGAEMVSHMESEGAKSSDILAVIGPSICEKCYIVDEPVISQVQNRLEAIGKKPYNRIRENQFYLDLKELNKLILIDAGIRNEHISITNLCTNCNHEEFFSHRKDSGKTGRMISFMGWKEA